MSLPTHPIFSSLYDVLDHTNHIFSESISSGDDNDIQKDKDEMLQRLNNTIYNIDMASCDDKYKSVGSRISNMVFPPKFSTENIVSKIVHQKLST